MSVSGKERTRSRDTGRLIRNSLEIVQPFSKFWIFTRDDVKEGCAPTTHAKKSLSHFTAIVKRKSTSIATYEIDLWLLFWGGIFLFGKGNPDIPDRER